MGAKDGPGPQPTAADNLTLTTSPKLSTVQRQHTDDGKIVVVVDGTTLGIIIGCTTATLLLIILAVVFFRLRQKRRKYNATFDEITDESFSRSAPNSRSCSPHNVKRRSCPEAFAFGAYRNSGSMERSMTLEGIPTFTLPPERIQPTERQRGVSLMPMQYQQSLLGSVQPDLYRHQSCSEDEESSLPPTTHGRLWYSLVYDAAVEQLSVTLVKVKDLPGRGKTRLARDPFVKVILLPDEKTCRISKVRKKTLSPTFNETFLFQVPAEDVTRRILRFSVYDVDKRRVRHSLGHVMIPLRDFDLTKGETMWSDLEPMAHTAVSLGEIFFSLAYLPNSDKIKVTIMKARNLRQFDFDEDTGMYVKVQHFYGRKTHKTKKTAVQFGSPEPNFNESFSFHIGGRQLEQSSVVISVMKTRASGRFSDDEEYGKVVVGSFMVARGEELMHWQEMLSQPRTSVSRWHTLTNTTPVNSSD
ncbi:synaptotagmin-15-like [Gigantopelta aegis]|uniref:synaptotagmin-15-like n=1 Tax=Gigantopelta aegis TaxID=1735272 RepID=UPI001B888C95|nr:synaptotagmin-15-like [Gigantopelta aegis]